VEQFEQWRQQRAGSFNVEKTWGHETMQGFHFRYNWTYQHLNNNNIITIENHSVGARSFICLPQPVLDNLIAPLLHFTPSSCRVVGPVAGVTSGGASVAQPIPRVPHVGDPHTAHKSHSLPRKNCWQIGLAFYILSKFLFWVLMWQCYTMNNFVYLNYYFLYKCRWISQFILAAV
jgi:hypothetical protein